MRDSRPNEADTYSSHDDANFQQHRWLTLVLQAIDCAETFHDDQGYKHEITAGAVHPSWGHIAWVEYKEKEVEREGRPWFDCEYRLKARVDGHIAIDWIIDTYNPFFGCRIGYLAWHGDHVVAIYREKHDCYACSLAVGQPVKLVEIAHQWLVAKDVIAYRKWQSAVVERLAIPGLQPLPPLTGEEAEATGLRGD